MRGRRLFALGVLGLVVLCCIGIIGYGVIAGVVEDREREATAAAYDAVFAPLEAVCDGQAAIGATTYQVGSGVHPAAVFRVTDGSTTNINDSLPDTWKPGTLGEAQLVVCLEPAQVLVETCEYDILGEGGEETNKTGQVLRYKPETIVRLLEAQSGKLVTENKFEGGIPAECPDSVSFLGGLTTQSRTGDSVGMAPIEEWLRSFVEIP